MKAFLGRLFGKRGYTIDQTILIVAIIAILITLVIVTVGWHMINRATSSKLASQLRQIEAANADFRVTYGPWPQESYLEPKNDALSALALTGTGVTFRPGVLERGSGSVRNLLSSATISNGAVRHSFSPSKASSGPTSGPGIYLREVANPFGISGRWLVIIMNDVFLGEARRAEEVVDDSNDFSRGRLVAGLATTGCLFNGTTNIPATAPDSQLIDVCYVANLLD